MCHDRPLLLKTDLQHRQVGRRRSNQIVARPLRRDRCEQNRTTVRVVPIGTSTTKKLLQKIKPRGLRRPLCQNSLDDVSSHIGQPEIPALEPVRQPQVVDAEKVQDRRVEVVDVHDVVDGLIAELVGGIHRLDP